MKKKQLILGALFFAGSVAFSYGQSDLKEWKKQLKDLTPEQYKELVEENNNLQMQLSESQNDADHYRSESQAKDAQITKLQQELEAAKGGSVVATPASQSTEKTETKVSSTKSVAGLIFKVQIGAFRDKNLAEYLDNHENFSGDVDADGTRKYTLGQFSDYWEANRFKKYLREMGVKDAWIVSYKDGKRVPIKDALEGVL